MTEPTLPERADDDSDIGWGESQPDDDDSRLRDDRPPHHDDHD